MRQEAAAAAVDPAGSSSFFDGSGGWKLHVESWSGADRPDGSVAAAVVFLHGVNESSQTLTARRLAARFVALGCSFHALEQHGHGLSLQRDTGGGAMREQPAGLIDSGERLIEHAAEACAHVASALAPPGTRIVLLGHSMGASVAALAAPRVAAAADHQLRAVALLAPTFALRPKIKPAAAVLAALSAVAWVAPSLAIGPPEHPASYCPPDVEPPGRNYDGRMRGRTAAFFLALEDAPAPALPAGVPAAVFVGAKDPIVDPRTGQLLVDAAEAAGGAGAARPEVIIFPQAGHQLIAVDRRWKTHVDAVATWVMAQLA